MMDTFEKKAEVVSVTALKFHTIHGKAYEAGATYDVDPSEVDNLMAQGMAKPSEQDAKAKGPKK